MYTYFRIQNFRGFKNLELKELAHVNLIGGKNNVGKTALLEAIAIHTGMYNPEILLRMDTNQIRSYGNPRTPRVEGLPSWNMIFTEFDTQKVITLSGNYTGQSKQLSLFNETNSVIISKVGIEEIPEDSRIIHRFLRNELLDNSTDIDMLEFKTSLHAYYVMNYEGRIRTDTPPPRRISSIFLLSREKMALEENAKRFSNLQRNRQQQIILEVLQLIDKRIKRLELLYDGFPPLIYADIGLAEPVPITTMGDGINRILSLILAMSAVQEGGVIFIDEIENGLHYSIQEDIWKAIQEASERFNVQVFATTHSLEMIRAAQKAFADTGEDDFRYYRLDRHHETNDPLAVKYTQKTMDAAMEMDYEVRG